MHHSPLPRRPLARLMVALIVAILVVTTVLPAVVAKSGTSHGRNATPVFRGTIHARQAAKLKRPHKATSLPLRSAKRHRGATTQPDAGAFDLAAPIPLAPDPVSVGAFAGLSMGDDGIAIEPPDPWIAASGSYLVQTVNSLMRVSDRGGKTLLTIPVWALFGLPVFEDGSDPRILWDAVHSRWVGVLVSYNGDLSANYLNLAISQSSDPRGAWEVWAYGYGSDLPDYPGIASSNVAVVLTAHEYEQGVTWVGSSALVVTWADLLAGRPTPVLWTDPDSNVDILRPALVLSPSDHVRLIGIVGNQVIFGMIEGDLPDAISWGNTGTDNLTVSAPTPPHQPGSPSTIAKAADARVTDAVWRNNHLWFVATTTGSDDGGSTFTDKARVTELLTTSDGHGNSASEVQTVTFGDPGMDAFMPGIGVAGDGTAFVVYSESSASQDAAIKAAAYKPGVGWSDDVTIADGEGTYLGERWGDYVGVAADPTGSAAVWQSDQIPTSDGDWRTIVSRLILDTVAPSTTAPVATVAKGTLASTAPVTLTWSGSDAGSGIAGYTLEQNRDGAGFESVATGLLTAGTTRALLPGFSYAFRTEGTDGYGNTSGVKTGPTLLPGVTQQSSSTTYHGTWTTSSSPSFSGGSARHSSQAGAYAQFSFTGRAIGFVTYRSSTHGSVKVYLDGVYKGKVKTYSSTVKRGQIVWVSSALSNGSHKLKLVVVGTSGHPRVDVDAFVVIH